MRYNKSSNDDKQGVVGQGDFTEESIEPFLHDVDRLLRTKNLRFSTIEIVYSAYVINKDAIDNYCPKFDPKICQRLCEYKTVIGFIQNGQVDSIKVIVNDDKKHELSYAHLTLLEQIVKDDKEFRENYKYLKSFGEIAKLYVNNGNEGNSVDTSIIEDATDKDNRITDPLDEEEVVPSTHKSRPKQKAVVIPIESKQGKKSSVGKEKEKSSRREKEIKHKYTCEKCGPDRWFDTQSELEKHCAVNHREE